MKKTAAALLLVVACLALLMQGCRKDNNLSAEDGEQYSGGAASVLDASSNAFGHQVNGLSSQEGLFFFVGNSFFRENWVSSPASTQARDGLGPLFQARSCSSCHLLDGRGMPPVTFGKESQGLLLRLSMPGTGAHGGPMPDPIYGDQLQDNSISGVNYEGKFELTYTEEQGAYTDGATYSLRKPTYHIVDLKFGNMAASLVSPRVAQQVIGMGLLGAIPEQTILGYADETDANGDGISGKPNYVWDEQHQTTALGRFGWKANQPSIYQQTCGAFLGDMGITTSLFPHQNCGGIANCDSLPNGGTPEISNEDLDKVVLYCNTLAVPVRRNWQDQDVLQGKQLFTETGCAACHIPKIQTGNSQYTTMANQTIRPYTDLLLHDMGNALADGRPDYLADGNEWRTPPLWGIGLLPVVNGHQYLLHDGRARNIEEAILWHGGEGENAKNKFKALSKADRDKMIKFLNSL